MTGIGGDCFVLLAEPDGSIHGYNGSGRSAKAARTDWFLEHGITEITKDSIHSVTVPGALKCWETLAANHGRMGLDAALAPAIDYAEKGVAITARVGNDWVGLADGLAMDPGAATHYLIDGRAPKVGERHAAPALAQTLRAVATRGTDAFYKGAIAGRDCSTGAILWRAFE